MHLVGSLALIRFETQWDVAPSDGRRRHRSSGNKKQYWTHSSLLRIVPQPDPGEFGTRLGHHSPATICTATLRFPKGTGSWKYYAQSEDVAATAIRKSGSRKLR